MLNKLNQTKPKLNLTKLTYANEVNKRKLNQIVY